MIALIQRVKHAQVAVAEHTISAIEHGILVLLGVEQNDDVAKANRLLDKILNYRIFSDADGKMNLNVQQVGGALLIVSQFTLAADTQKGNRPSFSRAATPEHAKQLYQHFCQQAAQRIPTQTGQFAADMQVSLQNDGPVTFYLHI